MANLTYEWIRPQAGDLPVARGLSIPCKANVKVFGGGVVGIQTADGYGRAWAATDRVAGIAAKTVDNTGGAAADKTIEVLRGAFPFKNDTGGNAVTQADVMTLVYIKDDQTATKDNASGVYLGLCVGIMPNGQPIVEVGYGR